MTDEATSPKFAASNMRPLAANASGAAVSPDARRIAFVRDTGALPQPLSARSREASSRSDSRRFSTRAMSFSMSGCQLTWLAG
jgi:hypothetical protein